MIRAPILALSLLALTACGGLGGDPGIDLSNVSVEEVAKQAVNLQQQKPGQWDITSELVSMEAEGLEKSPMAEMMKAQIGQKRTDSQCLSEEDTKKAMVPQDIDPQNNCRFDRFRMKGGELDTVMTCAEPGGAGRVEVTQKGSYSPESYDVTSTLKRSGGEGPGANSTMTMKVAAKRTGDCKA